MKVLIALVSIVLFTVLSGATLTVFWDWFIAGPQAPFTGVPQLSLVDAFGLSQVESFLTYQPEPSPTDEDFGTRLRNVGSGCLLGVVIGAAIVAIVGLLRRG